jgi:hypothetical protein
MITWLSRVFGSLLVATLLCAPIASARQSDATPVPAGACTIEPRSIEEFATLTGEVDPDNPDPPRDGGLLHESLPSGVPVDQETADEIGSLLADLVACINAGDFLRSIAFYTDHLIYARGPIDSATLQALASSTPTPLPADAQQTIEQIHSIEFLPGAKIAAIVTISGIDDLDPEPGITLVFILAMTTDGWRIDDFYDRIAPPDATEPVFVAELVD